jgi:hypothetical protein
MLLDHDWGRKAVTTFLFTAVLLIIPSLWMFQWSHQYISAMHGDSIYHFILPQRSKTNKNLPPQLEAIRKRSASDPQAIRKRSASDPYTTRRSVRSWPIKNQRTKQLHSCVPAMPATTLISLSLEFFRTWPTISNNTTLLSSASFRRQQNAICQPTLSLSCATNQRDLTVLTMPFDTCCILIGTMAQVERHR